MYYMKEYKNSAANQFCDEILNCGGWNIFPVVKAQLAYTFNCLCADHWAIIYEQILEEKENLSLKIKHKPDIIEKTSSSLAFII